MRTFTMAEVRGCDGREGRRALIVYGRLVYDVTGSFLWQGGRHQVLHCAGEDLTAAMAEAPHGEELMERVRVVGEVVEG